MKVRTIDAYDGYDLRTDNQSNNQTCLRGLGCEEVFCACGGTDSRPFMQDGELGTARHRT